MRQPEGRATVRSPSAFCLYSGQPDPGDYGALAQAFGARGVRVERMAELRHLLKDLPGLDWPTLVEVVVPKHDLAPQLARLAGAPAATLKSHRKQRAQLRMV